MYDAKIFDLKIQDFLDFLYQFNDFEEFEENIDYTVKDNKYYLNSLQYFIREFYDNNPF